MKEINLTQGTPIWHYFRRTHIGASDISAAIGCNPWRSSYDLWIEKTVKDVKVEENDAMRRGTEMEVPARELYEKLKGESFQPIVCEHDTICYLSASLDGISLDRKRALEIKCGEKSFKMAKEGIIPDYYQYQCQQIYLVTDCETLDYMAFNGSDHIIIPVERNDEMIENIKREAKLFHYCMENFISPNAIERKFEVVNE